MQKFVLVGKAKTVFQLLDLMAKGEKAERKARRIALANTPAFAERELHGWMKEFSAR